MTSSVALKEELHDHDWRYVTAFLSTIHFLTFVFVSRVKVFPELSQEEQFQRFLDVFFWLYVIVLRKRWVKPDKERIKAFRHDVMQKIQVFFMLFHFYQRMNTVFSHAEISSKEYYQWLFYDEMKPWPLHMIMQDFVTNSSTRTTASKFTREDQKIMKLILPADSQMKYLYQDEDRYLVADVLLTTVFENFDVDGEMLPFLKNWDALEWFLTNLLDHTRFKKNYFAASKKLANKKFKLDQSYETKKEIDSFMSTIEEKWSMEWVEVPDQLKAESKLMDRLLNFYVTFVGGLRVGRGDTFYARLFKKDLINELVTVLQKRILQQDSLYYYGGLLYSYSKNAFYYTYAADNVRAGNQSFQLPIKPSFKEVYSNMYILKLFDEYFVNTLIQDINKSTVKLSVTNEEIISQFRNIIYKDLSDLVAIEWKAFVQEFYRPALQHIQFGNQSSTVLQNHLTEKDREVMKDNLYTVDYRVWREWCSLLSELDAELDVGYGDMAILGMLSTLRETLFGLLLYFVYLSDKEIKLARTYHTQELLAIYCIDVLNISVEYAPVFKATILTLADKYHDLLVEWIQMDDNKEYLALARKNWLHYCKKQWPEKITQFISGEDAVRLRWFYKTVTYYNKRYLIPSQ